MDVTGDWVISLPLTSMMCTPDNYLQKRQIFNVLVTILRQRDDALTFHTYSPHRTHFYSVSLTYGHFPI